MVFYSILASAVVFIFIILPYTCSALSALEERRLEKGEILLRYESSPRSDLREVVGTVVFEASLNLVWEVITDYHHYADFLPDVEESRLVRRRGPQVWQYMSFPVVWPFPSTECTLLVIEDEEKSVMSFQRISGDYLNYYGSFRLEQYKSSPGRTLASYRLLTDLGTLMPSLSKDIDNRRLVYDQLEAFRKRINFEKLMDAGEPEEVIKPNWRKAFFWWERDESEENSSPR